MQAFPWSHYSIFSGTKGKIGSPIDLKTKRESQNKFECLFVANVFEFRHHKECLRNHSDFLRGLLFEIGGALGWDCGPVHQAAPA